MKHLDEYRQPELTLRLARAIRSTVTRSWTIMEVCGGQTHNIARFGLESLLPNEIRLAHGPGCPVCVTPVDLIDKSIALAHRPDVTLCSFGDMLRVPGSYEDLFSARAKGADVRIVYSPLDALSFAQTHPNRQVVFFAVGFETTAPANAMAVHMAARKGVSNFSILVSHVLVPPAMEAILTSPHNQVNGFLAAGHVCTITGETEYFQIASRFRVPIVVTGFEPIDILQGILMCVRQLESGSHKVENQYRRAVRREGNQTALALIGEIFEISDRTWRGIGPILRSGLRLRDPYKKFDALERFELPPSIAKENPDCIAGQVLRGYRLPTECPLFGTSCTPEHPQGAPMVSSEGACAAYQKYRPYELVS